MCFSRFMHWGACALGAPSAFGLAAAGCGGAGPISVRAVHPYGGHLATEGAVYFLPKSLVDVRMTVKVVARPKDACGNLEDIREEDYSATDACTMEVALRDIALADASLSVIPVPDEGAAFAIQTEGSFVVKSDFSAAFGEHGELGTTTAKSTDQSVQFASLGLEALAKIASIAAMAGPNATARDRDTNRRQARALRASISEIENRLVANTRELAVSSSRPVKGKAQNREAPPAQPRAATQIAEESAKLLDLRARLQGAVDELDRLMSTDFAFPVECTFEPLESSGKLEVDLTERCEAYADIAVALNRAGVGVPQGLPSAKLVVTPLVPKTPPSGRPGEIASPVSGFVYRIPAWATAELSTDSRARVSTVLPIPQWGRLAKWTIGDSDLRAGKTISIELYPGLGSVKSVTMNGEPIPLEQATKMVDAAQTLATSRETAEVERLSAQKAKLDAERELIEAKKALEEVR